MEREIERRQIQIMDRNVSIIVYQTDNNRYPFYATSIGNIDGAGETIEDAIQKCENALRIDFMMNR